MRILNDYSELVGKKIAFSHFAQFAHRFTLATEDGCVMMGTMDIDYETEEKEIWLYGEARVLRELYNDEWLRNELSSKDIFDFDVYLEYKREKERVENEERLKRIEERELEELARLQEKYKDRESGV